MSDKMRIKITKHGSYEVTGGVPVSKKIIVRTEQGTLGLKKLKDYIPSNPQHYFLCRCGRSKNMPFCDGGHEKVGFVGTEVAPRQDYIDRAQVLEGANLDMLDDKRCAFSRFCHRKRGDVWTLTEQSDDPENRSQAIDGITECPSGRLVARDKNGQIIEKEFKPEIEVIEDPQRGCSAGLYIKGNIEIEGADGTLYEVRNRVALCRCGHSQNMPFCDATHVSIGFSDKSR